MRNMLKSLLWFFLVPYFAVASFPARPWFGGSPENSRRTNAQLVLTIILICPLAVLVPTQRKLAEAVGAQAWLIMGAAMLLIWWFVSRWLRGSCERKYAAEYSALPRWKRYIFGLTPLMLMITTLLLVPSHAAPMPKSSPDVCDEKVTALAPEECYES